MMKEKLLILLSSGLFAIDAFPFSGMSVGGGSYSIPAETSRKIDEYQKAAEKKEKEKNERIKRLDALEKKLTAMASQEDRESLKNEAEFALIEQKIDEHTRALVELLTMKLDVRYNNNQRKEIIKEYLGSDVFKEDMQQLMESFEK